MNNVFFAKIDGPELIANKVFEAGEKWFNDGIDVGDYVFVHPNNRIQSNDKTIYQVSELWRAKKWVSPTNPDNKKLAFELITEFNPQINTQEKFIALKLFKLNLNLLNQCLNPVIGKCFFKLELASPKCLDIIADKTKILNYINKPENYRKVLILSSKKEVDSFSEDVQLYKENGEFKLFPASFINKKDIIDKFKSDNYRVGKTAGNVKGKFYKAIDKGETEITGEKASLKGFYDLFCSSNNDLSKISVKKRDLFVEWLKENGVSGAAKQYENGLRAIEKEFTVNIDDEYAKNKCVSLLDKLSNNHKVKISKGTLSGNQRNWESYLKKYIEYKNSKSDDEQNNIEEDFAQKVDQINEKISEEVNAKGYLSANTIFYGVPGCGKSHEVNNLLHIGKSFEIDDSLNDKFYKRILFHPEYTYSDFIGQIVPTTKEESISYEFQPGPFVEILRDALQDSENNYFLIIEEINRGNAPAIFGDIFQLLDREEDGCSEYPIYNKEIVKFLQKSIPETQKVCIPSNLTIFATMNTSDQNVFTIDTAFKRRWHMTRIPNNFKNPKDPLLSNENKIAGKNYSWKEFALALNTDIVANCNDGMIAEDKLLGTHFVKQSELKNVNAFAEKIFMYLWNDVVKYNKELLFRPELKTLDKVIEKFIANENVFNDKCEELLKLFNNSIENKPISDGENNE